MASDYTFDLTPARRPSLADLGGAAKQDDARYPPDPTTMATAQNWNQFARFMEGAGKLIPFAAITVQISGGTPSVASVQSMRSTLTTASFAITDNGTGDTTIDWSAIPTSFPPSNRAPKAYLVGDGSFLEPTCDTTTANTVRVRTRDNTNTLVDVGFVVEIF
jgi:hypothetical protein